MDSKLLLLINLEFSSYGRKQMLQNNVQSTNYHMMIIVVIFATHLYMFALRFAFLAICFTPPNLEIALRKSLRPSSSK